MSSVFLIFFVRVDSEASSDSDPIFLSDLLAIPYNTSIADSEPMSTLFRKIKKLFFFAKTLDKNAAGVL